MHEIVHVLRSSFRGLRRRPARTVVAVWVLALGLAASTALLTYLGSFYQRIPGVAEPDQLVRVYGFEGGPWGRLSFPDATDLAAREGALDGLAAEASFGASLRHSGGTHWTFGRLVSGSYFSLLGVEMAVGRPLAVADDRPEAPATVVLSDGFFRRHFDADAEVLGSMIHLDGLPFTVVGVAPASFGSLTSWLQAEFWIPAAHAQPGRQADWLRDREQPRAVAVARLSPDSTLAGFQSELTAAASSLDEAFPPSGRERQFLARPARRFDEGDRLSQLAYGKAMLMASGLLLLLACANVANLQLTSALERRRELAVHSVLGAGPRGVLRLLVAENLLLSLAAGGLGLVLAGPGAAWIASYYAKLLPFAVAQPTATTVDLQVFGLALAAAIGVGLLVGLPTAWKATRRDLVSSLKLGEGNFGGRLTGRSALVSLQVSLAVVLVVVAGLALRSLGRAAEIDAGFEVDRLLVANVSLAGQDQTPEQGRQAFERLREHLATTTGVTSVALADHIPLSGAGSRTRLEVEGGEAVPIAKMTVGAGYFETVGLEIQRGRGFAAEDGDAVVVNQALVDRYFGGEEPLGRILWSPARESAAGEDRARRGYEIVGVAANSRAFRIRDEPHPLVYFSWHQASHKNRNALVFATSVDPAAAIPAVRGKLRELDPNLALIGVEPLSEVVRGTLFDQHMNAELCSALGLLGLAMTAAGIFSLMSLMVSRRTREIGIRMALGARRNDVVALVVGQAVGMVGIGLVLGLLISLGATRFLRSLLYGVEATDPLAFAAATAVLLCVTVLASLPSTRWAASVDPVRSLRSE